MGVLSGTNMSLAEYKKLVTKYGYFTVRLDDNRIDNALQNEKLKDIVSHWVEPLLKQCLAVYLYHNQYLTPPPKNVRPIIISRTRARLRVDSSKMLGERYLNFWTWVLSARNMGIVLDVNIDLIPALASRSWDPSILTNLGAVIPRGLIILAKREVAKNKMVWVFSRDSYSVYVNAFVPRQQLLDCYELFVKNSRFILKGLERELKSEL